MPYAVSWGFKPSEFYRLNGHELEAVAAGQRIRRRRDWERTALVVAYLSAGTKKPVSAHQVLKAQGLIDEQDGPKKYRSIKYEKDVLDEIERRTKRG